MIDQAKANDKHTELGQATHHALTNQVVPQLGSLLDENKLKTLKEKLQYEPSLFHRDAREFAEGTRIEVMADMDEWASQTAQGPSVLLVTGLPGSGKSTLVDMWTNSRQNQQSFIFGARICFNRQREVRAKDVICSMVVQLLESTSSLQRFIEREVTRQRLILSHT